MTYVSPFNFNYYDYSISVMIMVKFCEQYGLERCERGVCHMML